MIHPPILIVPGYTNSGPDHWQSRWQSANPSYHRVEQADWNAPEVTPWVAALDHDIRNVSAPPILVAHSLGCITIAHWAERHPDAMSRVAAAMLVAPADVEGSNAPDAVRGFGPIPRTRLAFPSVVVASTTDEYATIDRARDFAAAWGARFIDIGDAGHINTTAGFGPWPEGERILASLATEVAEKRTDS